MKEQKQKFDIRQAVRDLWQHRKCLFGWCGCTTAFGIVIALTKPTEYMVTTSIVPEQASASGLASIASMMGVSMSGSMMASQDAIDPSMFPDVSASTPFLLGLCEAKVRTMDDTTLIPFREYIESEIVPWYVKVIELPAQMANALRKKKEIPQGNADNADGEPSRMLFIDRKTEAKLHAIHRSISVTQNAKTGVITIKASFQDPMATLMMADAAIDQLQQSIYDYKTVKAHAELRDLQALETQRRSEYEARQREYADFVSRNRSASNEIINVEKDRLDAEMTLAYQALQQVSNQRYLSEQSLIERKPSYAMLAPPTFPTEPAGSKKMIVILWFMLGFAISAGWVLWMRRWWEAGRQLIAELRGKKSTEEITEE